MQDMVRKGRHKSNSKLTQDMIETLCKEYNAGASCYQLSGKYGITKSTVQRAVNIALGSEIRGRKISRGNDLPTAKLTPKLVSEIRMEHATGQFTYVDLGRRYGVDEGTVELAVKRKTWKHVI